MRRPSVAQAQATILTAKAAVQAALAKKNEAKAILEERTPER